MTEAEILAMLKRARFDLSRLQAMDGQREDGPAYYSMPGLDGARFERLQERYLDEAAFRAAYGQHADPDQAINPETGVDLRDPYYAMRDVGWQVQMPAGDRHGNQTHVFNLGADGSIDASSYRLDDSGGSFVDHTLGKHGLSEMAETVVKDPKLMTFLAGAASMGAYSTWAAGAGSAAGSGAAAATNAELMAGAGVYNTAGTTAAAGGGLLSTLGISGAEAAMLGLSLYGAAQGNGGGAGDPIRTPALEGPQAPPSTAGLDRALINQAFAGELQGQAMQANRNPTKLVRPGGQMQDMAAIMNPLYASGSLLLGA